MTFFYLTAEILIIFIGSGLTVKQRSLLIILIILLCYVSLASALLAVTLNITFLDGLYLSVVSIETIGTNSSSLACRPGTDTVNRIWGPAPHFDGHAHPRMYIYYRGDTEPRSIGGSIPRGAP